MSIALSKTLPSGVDADFWIINSISANLYLQTAEIVVDGYISGDAHSDGKSPITSAVVEVVLIPTTVFPSISLLTALYTKVLADPFFADAVYTADGI